ncbi:MAG: DUF6015 family protein [Thermoplasmata archaeon]
MKEILEDEELENESEFPEEFLDNEKEFITYEELRAALSKLYKKRGIAIENPDDLASYILNLFGYSPVITDNNISPSDRNILYMLQDEGIIETTHERVRLLNKRLYTLFYWKLKTKRILELCSASDWDEEPEYETEGDFAYIYEKIPENVWIREKEY